MRKLLLWMKRMHFKGEIATLRQCLFIDIGKTLCDVTSFITIFVIFSCATQSKNPYELLSRCDKAPKVNPTNVGSLRIQRTVKWSFPHLLHEAYASFRLNFMGNCVYGMFIGFSLHRSTIFSLCIYLSGRFATTLLQYAVS